MEIKEEGPRHILILYNCKMDMAGGVDFSAANAKSSAQLRVKGDRNNVNMSHSLFVVMFELLPLNTFFFLSRIYFRIFERKLRSCT